MSLSRLTGWGRTAPSVAEVTVDVDPQSLRAVLGEADARGVLARGLGRSYGDAAQNGGGRVVCVAEHTVDVDAVSGVVRAGASVSFDELISALLPHGLFVPVSPGTRRITVGGAIAADIHGKNHHADGSWGAHVVDLEMMLASGEIRTVSPLADPELFWATIGGMGLTGVVLSCRFRALRVETSRVLVDTWRTNDLDGTMSLMAERDADYRYTVAWIDSLATGGRLGRGVVTMADHAPASAVPDVSPLGFSDRARIGVPRLVPSGLLNGLTVRAFNELWYRKSPVQRTAEVQGIGEFFHPLDMIRDWNRLYGRQGMLQYQFVVPLGAEGTLRAAIEGLARGGAASFLTVLKRFGSANGGYLSFPFPGWTLTLDVPTGLSGLSALLDGLDRTLVEVGGRVYLAKDSRLSPDHLAGMYPRLEQWRAVCERVDPDHRFQSDLSRRLGMRRRSAAST